jgi:hypothetical protein
MLALHQIEQEPRIRDTDLGTALGLDRPRKIRELIERNILELQGYGQAPRRGALVERPDRGSIEVMEYWLNEPQALLICMFARTDRAAEVRRQVIEIFMAWRHGRHGDDDRLAALERRVAMLEQTRPEHQAPEQIVLAAIGEEISRRKLCQKIKGRLSPDDVDAAIRCLVVGGEISASRHRTGRRGPQTTIYTRAATLPPIKMWRHLP